MLDLVKQETERIDSRFLEPACGDGNFLTVILERKLAVVESGTASRNWNLSVMPSSRSPRSTGLIFCLTMSEIADEGSLKYSKATYTRLFKAAVKDQCREAVGSSLSGTSSGAMP